ncbi:MAG TPA: hypothetical protein VNS63_10835, partial [Blastocatellia bacterium]|nr:hypothetical protein [Blastocatellia bacterium]
PGSAQGKAAALQSTRGRYADFEFVLPSNSLRFEIDEDALAASGYISIDLGSKTTAPRSGYLSPLNRASVGNRIQGIRYAAKQCRLVHYYPAGPPPVLFTGQLPASHWVVM